MKMLKTNKYTLNSTNQALSHVVFDFVRESRVYTKLATNKSIVVLRKRKE